MSTATHRTYARLRDQHHTTPPRPYSRGVADTPDAAEAIARSKAGLGLTDPVEYGWATGYDPATQLHVVHLRAAR